MDIFYHSLNDTSKGIIDASYCGAFKRKSAEEAKDLIVDLVKCNMKAPSEFTRSYSKARGSGVKNDCHGSKVRCYYAQDG